MILVLILTYTHYKATNSNLNQTVNSGSNSTTKQNNNNPNKSPTSASNTSSSSQTNSNQNSSITSLTTPWGDFVSNPSPDTSYPKNQEESVCNTTPNVTCTITFSKDGNTITLPHPETTDSNGAAYWGPWTPAQIQLTSGTWTITATASYGSLKASANGGTIIVQ